MKQELEYLLSKVERMKVYTHLGCNSEHHMENQIFRKLHDEVCFTISSLQTYIKEEEAKQLK